MAHYLGVRKLYELWADVYDVYPNPLIELEKEIVPKLAGDVWGLQILDVGCGTGRYADFFLEKGAEIIGVDFCWQMLSKAKQKHPRLGLILADVRHIPLSKSFDLVLCNLVLSHVMELEVAVAELARCTKMGGRVIISDLRTGFGFKKNKIFRIFKQYSTNSYKHTLKDYQTAFQRTNLVCTKIENLVFNWKRMMKYKRLFYLAGLTIGHVFILEKTE